VVDIVVEGGGVATAEECWTAVESVVVDPEAIATRSPDVYDFSPALCFVPETEFKGTQSSYV
jgi:hypothetical protein